MEDRQRIRGRVGASSFGSALPLDGPAAVPAGERPNDETGVDEAAADAARRRYRQRGLEPLEPDSRIGPLLAPNERVLAFHRGVWLNPPQASGGEPDPETTGDLYVTSERLLHLGRDIVVFDLDEIEDAGLSQGRVLLLFRNGFGMTVKADRPNLLRVQISTARAARAGSANTSRRLAQASSR